MSNANNQRLIIAGQEADMPTDGTGIPLYKLTLDYSNPTERGGDHTYTVSLPITRANIAIFGQIIDPANLMKFTRETSLKAFYAVGGITVFEGICELQSVSQAGYEVQFYSTNVQWIDHFSNNSLRTLQLPTVAFIGNASQDPSVEPVDAVSQPDIWALGPLQTDVVFNLAAYGNYPRNSPDSGERAWIIQDVIWQDIPPQVFMRSIVLQCFSEAGLTVTGQWINSTELVGLIQPYTGDTETPWNWGFLSRAKYERTTSFTFTDNVLGGGNYDARYLPTYLDVWIGRTPTKVHDYADTFFTSAPDNQYIVPVGGGYTWEVTVDITSLDKDLSYLSFGVFPDHLRCAVAVVRIPDTADELDAIYNDIGLYLSDPLVTAVVSPDILGFYDFGTGYSDSPMGNDTCDTTGTTYTQAHNGIPYGSPGSQIAGSGIVAMQTPECQLSVGDKVQVWIINTVVGNQLAEITIDTASVVMQARCSSLPDRLQPASLLPDWTRLEFFSGLLRMFNLYYEVNITNMSIRLDRRDEFFGASFTADDWSDRCEITNGVMSPLPFAEKTKFQYADDSQDALLSRHGGTFADTEIGIASISADKDQDVITLPWAPTYDRIYRARGSGATYHLLSIPCITSPEVIDTPQAESVWQYNHTPRILRHIGLTPGGWRYHGAVQTHYPTCRFSYDEISGQGLTWGQSDGLLHLRGSIIRGTYPSEGLFSRHWSNLFTDRVAGHVVRLPVQFDALTFSRISISRPIRIAGMVFHLYQLDGGFDPSVDTSLEVSLMRY
jgi:hypothetical protein